jgi:DNA-binding transcriptional ArsR family regulator
MNRSLNISHSTIHHEEIARTLSALAHPTRVRALLAFCDADLSPVALYRMLGDPSLSLGTVAYHVRELASAGLLELRETIQRRGAIEHRYGITSQGKAAAAALHNF